MKRKLLLFILRLLGEETRTTEDKEREAIYKWQAQHSESVMFLGPDYIVKNPDSAAWSIYLHDLPEKGRCESFNGKTLFDVYVKASRFSRAAEIVNSETEHV